jgi:hypothetical protein
MDSETAKLKARLDALEAALVVIARHYPSVQQAVQIALTGLYQDAVQASLPEENTGFPRNIHTEPRNPREHLAEQAKVDAYRDLLKKVERIN